MLFIKNCNTAKSKLGFRERIGTKDVFSVQKLLTRNSFYFVFNMNLINLKPTYYNTMQESNVEIPILRSIKASLCFSQVALNLLNNKAS